MGKEVSLTNEVPVDVKVVERLSSRVTKKHVDQLDDAVKYAMDSSKDSSERLGYITFAVANVLNDIGIDGSYKVLVARIYANMR